MLALTQWGGGSLRGGMPPPLAKTFDQFHYKILPFPDTLDEFFKKKVMRRLD